MIDCAGLTKVYRPLLGGRTVRALDDLTLTVQRGEVVGIAGPNGAGKSTLISLLLGFLDPTAGAVRLDGARPRAYVERRGVGYLTELVQLPGRWGVVGTLQRAATLGGMAGAPRTAAVERAIERLGLEEHRTKQVRQLSKGNLQRLGLAIALLGDHELLVLDEPTHGLDPVWTQRFRDLVRESRRPDRAILIASHNLDELERLADRTLILSQGRLQRIVTAADARGAAGTWRLALAAAHDGLAAAFPEAEPVAGRPLEWHVRGELAALNARLAALLAAGAPVVAFAPEESGLEREFRSAVRGDAA